MICPYMRPIFICPGCPHFYYGYGSQNLLYPPTPYRLSDYQPSQDFRASVTAQTEQKTFKNNYITADLKIPKFTGSTNPGVIKYINGNIENDIMEFKNQIESGAKDNLESDIKAGKKVKPYIASNVYQVAYNKNDILSVLLTFSAIINGTSNYVKTSYNYNLKTGRSMMLQDLFKPGVDYRKILNAEVIKHLQQNKEKYMKDAAAQFKGVAVDQPFYLTDDGIVLFFGFHQVAPFAAGIPLIKIPYATLKNVLKPEMIRE